MVSGGSALSLGPFGVSCCAKSSTFCCLPNEILARDYGKEDNVATSKVNVTFLKQPNFAASNLHRM